MADLIKNNGVPVPQFKSILSNTMREHVGGYAPYQQLIDNQGNPISVTNGLPVTGIAKSVTFHEMTTRASNGSVIPIEHFKTLTLEITGTATSHTIFFEASSVSGTYYPIQGVKISDFSIASQTTGKAEVWSFDVTGLETFRARISAIAGGNLTVKGKVVG